MKLSSYMAIPFCSFVGSLSLRKPVFIRGIAIPPDRVIIIAYADEDILLFLRLLS